MVEKVKNSDRKVNSPQNYTERESTMLSDQTMELNFVRNKLETFQANILRDVQKRMSGMIDEVLQDLRQHELQAHEFRNFAKTHPTTHHNSNTWSNRIRHVSTANDSPASEEVNTENAILNDGLSDKQINAKPTKGDDDDDDGDDGNVSLSPERKISHNSTEEEDDGGKDGHKAQRVKKKQSRTFPEKVFRTRESYLTALLEVDHMKTIYHIFYIIFMVFLLNNITYDYLIKGSVSLGLGTFKGGFAKIHYVLGIWLIQKTFVFSIYYALNVWSKVRTKLKNQKLLQRLWSLSCLALYIPTQLLFAYLPTKLCLQLDLPYVSACVLLLESIRMLMKMHGFVRTICARVLNGKLKIDGETETKAATATAVDLPPFEKYLYFLFAPTFLYRDNYPRTSVIRWKFAASRFFEVVAVAFLYSYVYERHIKQHFENFGLEEMTAASLTVKLFGMLMPCIIIYLCGFYMILHSWLNFAAEILRFGDRMFYRDWWTANNYEAYYRNWNVVVHDWLYEYIYKDIYTYIFKGSKLASSLVVFTISALFHEYILGYALQVFFPVMFVFFGVIGVLLIFLTRFVPKNVGNIMVWFSLIYGNCMMICLYSMEYFTSKNCPKESYETWSDILVPHLWTCYMK